MILAIRHGESLMNKVNTQKLNLEGYRVFCDHFQSELEMAEPENVHWQSKDLSLLAIDIRDKIRGL